MIIIKSFLSPTKCASLSHNEVIFVDALSHHKEKVEQNNKYWIDSAKFNLKTVFLNCP